MRKIKDFNDENQIQSKFDEETYDYAILVLISEKSLVFYIKISMFCFIANFCRCHFGL